MLFWEGCRLGNVVVLGKLSFRDSCCCGKDAVWEMLSFGRRCRLGIVVVLGELSFGENFCFGNVVV